MKKFITFLFFLIMSVVAFIKDYFLNLYFGIKESNIMSYTLGIDARERQQLSALLDKVERASRGYGNYNPNANYGGDKGILNYNPNAGKYRSEDGILRIGGAVAADWAQDKQASVNLATYRIKAFYTPVALIPLPVDIRFFGGAYALTTSAFVAGNQVFTNAGGDTVTIVGRSRVTNWQQMVNINEHENMCIEFLRIRPKSESQLENPIVPFHNSQFSSSSTNEISPDDYITPNQYQLLRADVPLGYNVGLKKGFDWTVDPDQTGTGMGMVMFMSAVIDKDMALKNQPMIQQFGNSTAFFTPTAPVGAIDNLIAQKMLANKM